VHFGTDPGMAHWSAVKHLLQYLKVTMKYTLTYQPNLMSTEPFTTFSNADNGGYKDKWQVNGWIPRKSGHWSHLLVFKTARHHFTIFNQSCVFSHHGSRKGNLLDVKPYVRNGHQTKWTIDPTHQQSISHTGHQKP